MPSRRLRVARRFWSSSRALSWARSAGGTAWPGGEPERVERVGALLGVAQLGDRLRVVARDLEEPGGRRDRRRRGAHLECEPERLGATAPGLLAGGEAMRHADVALRLAGGPLGQLGIDAVASDEEGGDLGDGRASGAGRCARGIGSWGCRSASLGAQRIHTVRSGGSSSSFSRKFEVRSVMRSASSMMMTRWRPTDGE